MRPRWSLRAKRYDQSAAEQLPGRHLRRLADGGYATKDYVRQLPHAVHVVGRLPINAKLYEVPPTPAKKRRGAPRKKGAVIGSPKILAETATGWVPHPTEAGAEVQAWCGLWHAVLPGRLIRVVVLRRDAKGVTNKPGHRNPLPVLEAFFTTDLALSTTSCVSMTPAGRWKLQCVTPTPSLGLAKPSVAKGNV
jgi:hypothetical protein